MIKNIFCICLLALATGCCYSAKKIQGTWLQAIPGQQGALQGMIFEKGGKAKSLNMHTLVYETWIIDGDTLKLTGKSIGNGQAFDFTESANIKQLSNKKLVLETNGIEDVFIKQKQ